MDRTVFVLIGILFLLAISMDKIIFSAKSPAVEQAKSTQPWGHEIVAISASGKGILDEAKAAIVSNAQPSMRGGDEQGGPSFSYGRWNFAGEGSNVWVVTKHDKGNFSTEEIARLIVWFRQVAPGRRSLRIVPKYSFFEGRTFVASVIVDLEP